MSDDKKDAVNIGVTLSGQLITAALAMIAVIGTFGTFIADKRDIGYFYYLIVVGAFLSFVTSIYYGGKGINQARNDGFGSNWNLTETKTYFNKQAIGCFIGIFLFIVSVFSDKQKPDDLKTDLSRLTEMVTRVRMSDSITKSKVAILEKKVDSLEKLQSKEKITYTCKRFHK